MKNPESAPTTNPFDFVLFGGTGDLALRKLLPALYFRHMEDQLADDGRIICVARKPYDTAAFRELISTEVKQHIPEAQFDQTTWDEFIERVF